MPDKKFDTRTGAPAMSLSRPADAGPTAWSFARQDSQGRRARPLAIYIHWPFCRSKCPYCDFNSHVMPGEDAAVWEAALLGELRSFAAFLGSPAMALPAGESREVVSVFFGGGTPSLMPPALVESLLQDIARHWTLAGNCEITLEANPTSAEAASFQGFRAAGVNRLSLGVQALNDRDLAFLGREHSVEEAIAAITLASRIFPRHSLDLITARPDQSPQQWRAELNRALDLARDHISVYQLTYEPDTLFGEKLARGKIAMLEAEQADDLYLQTGEILEETGLPAYEISNHARPGSECRHNLIYWQSGDYLGIGPGAHGRLTRADGRRLATEQIRAPRPWLQACQEKGQGDVIRIDSDADTARGLLLDPAEFRDEMLLMGLRLRDGIPGQTLSALIGSNWRARLQASSTIRALAAEGLLSASDEGLKAMEKGRMVLNALIVEISRAFSDSP